jgi:hypothetical protein
MFILPPPLKNADYYLMEDLERIMKVNRDVVKMLVRAEGLKFPQPINHGRYFYLKADVDDWLEENNAYGLNRKQLVELSRGYDTGKEKITKVVVTDGRMDYQACFNIFHESKKILLERYPLIIEDEEDENE